MDLQVLRTARAAVEEGLIQEADFDVVKSSFLKAQSIKAGLDAGFINEFEFSEARTEFFRSLVSGVPAPSTSASPAPYRAAAGPSQARPAQPVAPAPVAPVRAPVAAPSIPAIPTRGLQTSVASLSSDRSLASSDSPLEAGMATMPSGVPDNGGAAATAGKASMSGIGVHASAVDIAWQMRVRKQYRWITFKIGAKGKEVIVDKLGERNGSSFEQFRHSLPSTECRYAVYDYEYDNSEGITYGKMVFFSWAPEVAPTKAKMQHASTKDFFRGFLDGLSVDLHATEPDELIEDTVRERVQAMVEGRR